MVNVWNSRSIESEKVHADETVPKILATIKFQGKRTGFIKMVGFWLGVCVVNDMLLAPSILGLWSDSFR